MNNYFKKDNRRWYEALGFIESLMAIILVGVASVVLMRIAANTMMDTVQNERIDKMTQYAIEVAIMTESIVQEMIEEGKNPIEELGLTVEVVDSLASISCFVPYSTTTPTGGKFDFKRHRDKEETYKTWDSIPVRLTSDKRKELGMEANAGLKEIVDGITRIDYFRVACFNKIAYSAIPDVKELSVRIIVGHTLSKGDKTKGGNVKDYIYDFKIPLE